MSRAGIWLVTFAVLWPPSVQAGQDPASVTPLVSPAVPIELPPAYDGPPLPLPPEIIARDAGGRATIRAVRLTSPLRIDGRLDEALYGTVPAMSDFVQMDPQHGSAATEKTEVWLAFDNQYAYVSFRCWETQPQRLIANEMRRDHSTVWNGDDQVSFMLDTFYDRRNSVEFTINAIGG